MNKPSFWTLLGTIGELSANIAEAYSDDNKIDIAEIINIGAKIVEKIDATYNDKTNQSLKIMKLIAKWLETASVDKKISATEIIDLFDNIATNFGYDFDTTGIDFSKYVV